MVVEFECNVGSELCRAVGSRILEALRSVEFPVDEVDVRVVIGRPSSCIPPCAVFNVDEGESLAYFNTLASIFALGLGEWLRRRGGSCKYWVVDGLAALLAARVLRLDLGELASPSEVVGVEELEREFGFLRVQGPGMVVAEDGDLGRAVAAAGKYLGDPRYRVSAARAVESMAGGAPGGWREALDLASRLCGV